MACFGCRPAFFVIGFLAVVHGIECRAEPMIPDVTPKLSYCMHYKDGKKFCAKGKNLTNAPDGTLVFKNGRRIFKPDEVASIESYKRAMLPAVLIASAVCIGGGVALVEAIGVHKKGDDGDPSSGAMYANIAGVSLVILGPLAGMMIGEAIQKHSTKVVYPTLLNGNSGGVPGLGISGTY